MILYTLNSNIVQYCCIMFKNKKKKDKSVENVIKLPRDLEIKIRTALEHPRKDKKT